MLLTKRLAGIKPANIVKSILLSVFLCCFFGCAYIPVQEQLVSATRDKQLTRSNGECTESAVKNQQTGTTLPGLSPNSISIFDWNMHKGQDKNWDVDFLRLSRATDIILLQEASLNDRLQDVLEQKNLHWNLNSAFKYRGVETGVLVASTIQPLDSCGLRQPEPIIGLPKTSLINRYQITGATEELLVVNIHGINMSLGIGAYQQQLDGLQNMVKKHDGPIIVAGDFNNWSKKRTAIMARLIENLSLHVLTFDDEVRTTFFGGPVDHILYRGLKPVTYAVHPVTSSDHNPISVTFRLLPSQPVADVIIW